MSTLDVLPQAGQIENLTANLGLLVQTENPTTEKPVTQKKKHSHRKKRTPAQIMALCKITENKEILDVPPDKEHAKLHRRRRRVNTYKTYEEYLAAKMRAQEHPEEQNSDESEIVSESEFNLSSDTVDFEDLQEKEKDLLELELFEEGDYLSVEKREEIFENLSHPQVLIDIQPNRNACYDGYSANIERGMPGNPLEREIEAAEERERKELEEDLRSFNLSNYPEPPLATQLELNFASDELRPNFGQLNDALDESMFSVSEMNPNAIILSPGSPRSASKNMRGVCMTGTVTLLSSAPDDEKVADYQNKIKKTKHFTHVKRVRTQDFTADYNDPNSGQMSNVKILSKSTLGIFSDSEEFYKTEEGLSLQKALTEELEEDERDQNNHVIEGKGLSVGNDKNNLATEYSDITIYSDEEQFKSAEEKKLENEIEDERTLEIEEKAKNPPFRSNSPPVDIFNRGDGTYDVGVQAIRCDIDELINRRPSKKQGEGVTYADYIDYEPKVFVQKIDPVRNSCYDTTNTSIERGMPNNPLEEEILEYEIQEEKEREEDAKYYTSTLYKENAINKDLEGAENSDALRNEFGNRPILEEIVEEEEVPDEMASESEASEYHNEEESEAKELAPPTQPLTKSPRIKRRVKKPVLKTADTQCSIIHTTPLEDLRLPPSENQNTPEEPISREVPNQQENQNPPEEPNSPEVPNQQENQNEIKPPLEEAVNPIIEALTNQVPNEVQGGELENAINSNLNALLNNNDNTVSEMSENIPPIQMPQEEADSSALSPRARAARQGNPRSSSKNSYRATTAPNNQNTDDFSQSYRDLKEKAMNLKPIVNAKNEQLEQLINSLEKEKAQLMRKRLFKDGLKCNAAIKHVESILNKQKAEENGADGQFDQESRKKEAEIKEKQRQALRELREKHNKELGDLYKQWNSLQTRKKYNKPSDRVKEMKKQYDRMVINNDPEQAEEMNQLNEEIKQLRKIETEEAYRKMQDDYDFALFKLKQKHKQDYELLRESYNVKLDQFKQQRARDKRALDLRKTVDQNQLGDLLAAQSERYDSEALAILFSNSDAMVSDESKDAEKLNLPPLNIRKPKILRYANPDSS